MMTELRYSRHNIVAPVRHRDSWFIVNVLSGQADLISADQGLHAQNGALPEDPDDRALWLEKGYVVDPEEEARRERIAYLDFLDQREKDEVQVFFVPWYSCNFSCTYCFQESYGWEPAPLKKEVVDSFFKWISTELQGRRKYITLFGGEPLLPGERSKAFLEDFILQANALKLDLAIVTNGYTLLDSLDILSKARLREIQVTLDGPATAHDSRRKLKGGGATFERIAKGVDAALALGMTINMRMVVDKENLHSLPELAQIAKDRGWTSNPLFKTQLGRNYELHTCQVGNEKLYSRVELHNELADLVKAHPVILEFHKPAFSISRFLFENGSLPAPLFDSCTGTKTEWALDGTGRIYSCTATVGKAGEELGTFWPTMQNNRSIIDQWQERDVHSILECQDCSVRLACGGGCTSVAKNASGRINSPDCRPVRDLLSMGIDLYHSQGVNHE